jgi:hypothetical protein
MKCSNVAATFVLIRPFQLWQLSGDIQIVLWFGTHVHPSPNSSSGLVRMLITLARPPPLNKRFGRGFCRLGDFVKPPPMMQ